MPDILIEKPENVALHFFWIGLPVILSQIVIALLGYRRSHEEAKRKDAQNEIIEANFPRHGHGEWKDENSEGPLNAKNIRYPQPIRERRDK